MSQDIQDIENIEDILQDIQEVVGKTADRNTLVNHVSVMKKCDISLYILIFLYTS